MTLKGVKRLAEELAGMSVSLLLTHADPDHVGALSEFDSFMMHPAERGNLKMEREFVPLSDGDVIEL